MSKTSWLTQVGNWRSFRFAQRHLISAGWMVGPVVGRVLIVEVYPVSFISNNLQRPSNLNIVPVIWKNLGFQGHMLVLIKAVSLMPCTSGLGTVYTIMYIPRCFVNGSCHWHGCHEHDMLTMGCSALFWRYEGTRVCCAAQWGYMIFMIRLAMACRNHTKSCTCVYEHLTLWFTVPSAHHWISIVIY